MQFLSTSAADWLEKISGSKHMYWLLFVLSMLETIIVPIPMELVLIPLMATHRDKIWQLASVTLAGCIVASLIGYGVGVALYESLGNWFIHKMGYEEAHKAYQHFFDNHGFWAILIVGIVPIPFQLAMITAGVANYPIALFTLAALISRGIRYYGLASLVKYYGERAKTLWKEHKLKVSLIVGGILLALYLIMQFIADTIMN